MQVDPIKLVLKAPGTNLLTLKYDEPLLTFALNFTLCRYIVVGITLFVLINCTLIAQLAKCGELFNMFTGLSTIAGNIGAALLVAGRAAGLDSPREPLDLSH